MSEVQEGPRRGAYLFSPETVRRAAEFYEKVRKQPYRTEGIATSKGLHDWWLSSPGNPTVAAVVDRLPTSFQNRIFGMAVWQWAGLLLMIPIGVILMYLAFRIGRVRGERTRERNLLQYWASLLFPIVAMLVPLAFKHIAFEYLTIRGNALYVVVFAADLVFLLALLVVIGGGCSRIAETIVALPNVRARGVDGQLIRIVGRLVGCRRGGGRVPGRGTLPRLPADDAAGQRGNRRSGDRVGRPEHAQGTVWHPDDHARQAVS